MRIAIKVGGSVFYPDEKPDINFIKELSRKIIELSRKHTMLVIVGGGKLARKMIMDEKKKSSSKDQLDMVGIVASRFNALVLLKELGKMAYADIPKNEKEVSDAIKLGKIVVIGGFRPGQTTDAVTLQSAKAVGCELVIIGTDVNGVYNKDPKIGKDATLIKSIDSSALLEMTKSIGLEPGEKIIVDPVAAEIIHKERIKTFVLNIRNLDNLQKAINGEKFLGTKIE